MKLQKHNIFQFLPHCLFLKLPSLLISSLSLLILPLSSSFHCVLFFQLFKKSTNKEAAGVDCFVILFIQLSMSIFLSFYLLIYREVEKENTIYKFSRWYFDQNCLILKLIIRVLKADWETYNTMFLFFFLLIKENKGTQKASSLHYYEHTSFNHILVFHWSTTFQKALFFSNRAYISYYWILL